MIIKRKLYSLLGYRSGLRRTWTKTEIASELGVVNPEKLDIIEVSKGPEGTELNVNNLETSEFHRVLWMGPGRVKEIQKTYSVSQIKKAMLDKVVAKLERNGYEDFNIVSRIPGDAISVTTDLNSLKIYLPKEYEFDQYGIDDFLRGLAGYIRTRTVFDRDIYVMTVLSRLTEDQYCKLLQHIIDEEEFVAIINNEED